MWCTVVYMFFFRKPASPRIVWRNPTMPPGTRRTKYRTTVSEGRKYKVLERVCPDNWVVVTVLTVLDGRPKVAA